MNLLLFGPPGAGKGTQSSLLVDNYELSHISTGDLFRNHLKNETPLGLEAKKFIDAGNLVPDSVTIRMVEDVFSKLGEKGFILDGFPRTVAQAEALEDLTKRTSRFLKKVVFLEVPKESLISRLTGRRVCKKCGSVYHVDSKPTVKSGVCDSCGGEVVQRSDDKLEAIENRLKVYEEQTSPVKLYYKKQGKLVEVDGTGTAEEVFARVVKEIS